MLLRFPKEVVGRILTFLDFRELVGLQVVSQQFRELVQESMELQYIIELGVAGMEECSIDPSASIRDRLLMLKTHEDKWKNPILKLESIIRKDDDGSIAARDGRVIVFMKKTRTNNAHDIHTRLRVVIVNPTEHEECTSWTLNFVEKIEAVTIDPAHDLLIAAEFVYPDRERDEYEGERYGRKHVLSLRYGTPHPDAVYRPIKSSWSGFNYPQIEDELVVFAGQHIYDFCRASILVLDWKRGMMREIMSERKIPSGFPNFRLLPNRRILFPLVLGPDSNAFIGLFAIGDLNDGKHLTALAAYELPAFTKNPSQISFTGYRGGGGGYLGAINDSFRPVKSTSILAITFGEFEFFAPEYIFSIHNSIGDLFVPWGAWGPSSTRYISKPSSLLQFHRIQGQRVILSSPACLSSGVLVTNKFVLDFNPYRARRDLCRGESRGENLVLELDLKEDVANALFSNPTPHPSVQDFPTSLPYRTTMLSLPEGISASYHRLEFLGESHLLLERAHTYHVLTV